MVIRYAAGALLAAACGLASAGQLGIEANPQVTASQQELLDSIRTDTDAAMQRGVSEHDFDWAKEDEAKAEQAAAGAAEKAEGSKIKRKESGPAETYVIYVSWSLGAPFIKDLLLSYKDQGNVVLKFRGIPDGLTMLQSLTKIQRLTHETKSPVTMEIDPVSFSDNQVTMVPFVAKYQAGKVVAVAKGTAAIEVFDDKPGVADLGVVGDQVEIAEVDMIELMKDRASKINFAEKKEKALKRFWANQQFNPLPPASEHRVRKLDPTIVVPQDMVTPDGTMIHKAGTRINPLSIRPFTQRLVVVDPAEEGQLTLAREQIQHFGKNQLVTIILTSVESESGWEQLKQIEESLGQPAYILPVEVKERFDLEHTPSVVTADSQYFYIEEFSGRELK